jgi:hypothetical protein
VVVTSMPRSRAITGPETMLISGFVARITPATAAADRARVFISAAAPLNRRLIARIGSSVIWPTKAPRCDDSRTQGVSTGASSAVIDGMLTAFDTAPWSR